MVGTRAQNMCPHVPILRSGSHDTYCNFASYKSTWVFFKILHFSQFRAFGTRGARGHGPPDLERSVKPILTRGWGQIMPTTILLAPFVSLDLPTALLIISQAREGFPLRLVSILARSCKILERHSGKFYKFAGLLYSFFLYQILYTLA